MVLALQSMITRTVDVFDPAVLTVAKLRAGTTDNVIPESAQLTGTLRAVSERTRTEVWERIRTVADGIAAAHGCTAEVQIKQGYPRDGERRRLRRASPPRWPTTPWAGTRSSRCRRR